MESVSAGKPLRGLESRNTNKSNPCIGAEIFYCQAREENLVRTFARLAVSPALAPGASVAVSLSGFVLLDLHYSFLFAFEDGIVSACWPFL